jgi:hypothetical protein
MTEKLLKRLGKLESRLSKIPFKLGHTETYLTFQLPGNTTTIDEYGVEIPSTTLLTVKAYLTAKKRKTDWEITQLPFINSSTVYMEGFVVEPEFLPGQCRPMSEGEFLVNDPDYPLGGRFLLLPPLPDENGFYSHSIRVFVNLGVGAPSPLTLPIIGIPYPAPTQNQALLLVNGSGISID